MSLLRPGVIKQYKLLATKLFYVSGSSDPQQTQLTKSSKENLSTMSDAPLSLSTATLCTQQNEASIMQPASLTAKPSASTELLIGPETTEEQIRGEYDKLRAEIHKISKEVSKYLTMLEVAKEAEGGHDDIWKDNTEEEDMNDMDGNEKTPQADLTRKQDVKNMNHVEEKTMEAEPIKKLGNNDENLYFDGCDNMKEIPLLARRGLMSSERLCDTSCVVVVVVALYLCCY